MTVIKATCPRCGEVDVMHEEIRLMVCKDNESKSYYAFDCPSCVDEIRKHADGHVISLLMSGGVKPHVWQLPPGYAEQQTALASQPPLTYDDLLDFCVALQSPDHHDCLSISANTEGQPQT